jgi:hypothetical protein
MTAFPSDLYDLIASETPPVGNYITFRTTSVSGRSQAGQMPGHFWTIEAQLKDFLYPAEWRKLLAFLQARRGQYDPFTYIPRSVKTPLGTPGGTPQVVGAVTAGAHSLSVDGWTINTTVLKAGDFFKFANHTKVYVTTADVVSDGTGLAAMAFEPGLVANVADNEGITHTNVPFTVASQNDAIGFEATTQGNLMFSTTGLKLIEVF